MGCFLSKNRKKCRKHRENNKVLPRHQEHVIETPPQQKNSSEQAIPKNPPNHASELLLDKVEEQSSSSAKKKVTFDSNVKTYEPIACNQSVESLSEIEKIGENEKDESLKDSSQSYSVSENDSISSSVGSYPPNHRYQNCRDSDDEGYELDDEDGDYGEDEEEEDFEYFNKRLSIDGEVWSEAIPTESMESRTKTPSAPARFEEEVESPMIMSQSPERGDKAIGPRLNRNARDRSVYVHSVLNPVENIAQWKAAKSKVITPTKPEKENLTAVEEPPRIAFTFEPSSKDSSFRSKSAFDQSKHSNQDISVDASLSNWLPSAETTPKCKTNSSEFEIVTSAKSTPRGSNSTRNFEDRPILGALTLEELKQFSANSSPKKSLSRSPDDMPIIGTVGTYWNPTGFDKDPRPVSSFKGIPNTTSKYREDKRVNWHSTPFKTRLERALNRGSAEA